MEQFFLKLPKWAITTLSCCVSGLIAALAFLCLGLTWGIFRGDLIGTPYFKITPQLLSKLNVILHLKAPTDLRSKGTTLDAKK